MYFHRVLLLLIPTIYLVVPLVIDSWQSMNGPWYLPYLAWLSIVIIAFTLERKRCNNV
jgi:hypothetical protein